MLTPSAILVEESFELSKTLRELRRTAGTTGTAVAEQCGFSQSKLSKIETGQLVPSNEDLICLLKVLWADQETTARILERRSAIAAEMQSWRLLHLSGFAKHQLRLSEIECQVDNISVFQTAVIPGLLQTKVYAAAVIERAGERQALKAAVQSRLDRQSILDDLSKSFSFVIAQSALMWRYTDEAAHKAQLDALRVSARRKNVEIRVLPFDCCLPELPLHSFCVFGNRLVTVELINSQASFVEGELGAYQNVFDRLRAKSQPLKLFDTSSSILGLRTAA